MGQYLWLAVVLLLALYGFVQGIGQLICWIWRPRREIPAILILPISGHCEDVEYTLRCALTRQRWAAGITQVRILLMDTGMDEETRALARAVCDRMPGVEFCRGTGAFQM